MRARAVAILSLGLALLPAACGVSEPPAAEEGRPVAAEAGARWDAFVEGYIEQTLAAQPHFAVYLGRHELDGRLPDLGAEGIAAEIARLHAARETALGFDAAALDGDRRFQRDYLLARIDGELFWLEEADWPRRNPLFYADALDPDVYLTRPYAPLAERLAAYTRYAEAVPEVLAQMRAQLHTPLPRTYVDLGSRMFAGYAEFMRETVPGIFAGVDDAALQARFATANAAAAEAMAESADWFQAQRESATDDFALGEALFRRMLWRTERVGTELAELKAIGEADLARNLQALAAACAKFAPGAAIADCIARAQSNKPEGGPVAGARRQLDGLKRFLVEQDLVSIPSDEEARVEEAPPYRRFNAAYISIPGPWEKGMPATYYIAPPDESWSAAERNAYIPGEYDLKYISVHEVWPGHFLNFLHANRSPDLFGRVFVGYAFAEGWAHYSEEMMWDAGLDAGNPESHIGQLLNALLRDVRFVCAIGLHTEGMTVEQCEALFRDKAYQDPGNARQQAARGTFDPAYLNYTMGKLMIRRLREDWTATRGGRAAWKNFHDAFLSYGGPPIPLVRGQMLDTEPKAAF